MRRMLKEYVVVLKDRKYKSVSFFLNSLSPKPDHFIIRAKNLNEAKRKLKRFYLKVLLVR
ncbi:hypothetical protein DRO54_11800 [Candidatus Bathyarchaeota archaeon]|nr:MAG: hypothetical protein DRO54_11800 [Candidatus Bathyarchaeota archaeon]